jgi:hypothetical protein
VGASKLKDTLGIHFDDAGRVIGLEYAPSNRTCGSLAFARKLGTGAAFKTTVKLHTKGLPGPRYVAQDAMRCGPCAAGAGAGGGRGLLYWMSDVCH